jgi:glycosyltransferase involved in cell wall biosynthesis
MEFEKHPEADLIYCDVLLIDKNNNPIRIINKPEYKNRRYLIRDLLRAGHPVIPFRFGIKRSVFERIGFYDEDLLIGEDYDMIRRFVKAGLKAHHLSEPLHLRRMHTDSLSTNHSTQNAKCHFEVIKRFTDTFTYYELFPDVAWDEIALEMRNLHAKCLTVGIYLALAQDYIKANALEYSKIALYRACSELNDCIKMDPKNQDLLQLYQKILASNAHIQSRITSFQNIPKEQYIYDQNKKIYCSDNLTTGAGLEADVSPQVLDNRKSKHMKRKRTGIIVFGHSRPLLLRNLLESLRRQGTTNDIHVWLDGHHGRSSFIEPTAKCRELIQKEFQEVHLTAMNSNMGIEKLTIDGLSFMSSQYERIIVLEDDCFPTANAIAEFEQALDEITTRPEVYSVYGHHLLTETEGETITRFQGWGWATTREKLLPVLAEMKRCFAMAEPDYLQWVHQNLTPEVIRRLDVTPGRNCVRVITSFFCWDGCTCLVTAIHGLVHKKTRERVIYNCGMGDGSTHFPQNDKFRLPPFNMITPQEVWSYYDSPPKKGSHSLVTCKAELAQTTSPRATTRTNSSTATFPGHKSQARQAGERDHKEHSETQIVVDGLIFTNVKRTKHLNNSVGFNGKYIIKIEHKKHPLKLRSLSDEIEIIKHLNSRECVSCPRLLSEGWLKTGERYFIQERVKQQRGFNTADMLFSILEQKNLGVCEGDLKRQNLIFDSNSVCYIIDYDQAIYDERFVRMGNVEYLDWFAQFFADRWKRYGHTDFYKWGGYDKNEIFDLFRNDSFNLAATTLFKEQITTDTKSGIYHTLRTDKVYIDGARDLNPRLSALNTIEFKKGESVLDVGCNMGLFGHYLHDRGCRVTGIDMDGKIIIGAKMVANILNKDIQFKHLDLDTEKIEMNYDTICLFSVIHHVQNVKQITENIAQRCNRIILECRLKEHGSKPIGGKWTNTSGWEFNSLQELTHYFEVVFKGFKFQNYHGNVDRDREIISFEKIYAPTAIQIQSNSPTDIQENKFVSQQSDNKSEYLVSAVVSTYNSERFIRGCLEDLEHQTIADKLEIIVVNSGSQENEEEIVHEYQQKYDNIVYIKTEQREGIYAAWNRAVKVARGTFLTNANTDDRHRDDALEIMAETLLANPDAALVYGDQICTDTPNGIFADHHTTNMAKRPEYSHERLLFGNCVGSQPMWRKSLHSKLGYFDDMLTCAGDWDFWLRISNKYKFKHIPEFLGLYYYNENGIEHGKNIHSLYERYIVGKRYGNPYISVIPLYTNKDNPLVSVIMPAYNAGEYITEAIESVLIQNYRNFKLIVIDDGSTDNTKDIVASFKNNKIKYFYQENKGLAGAQNTGIKISQGPFLIKLDSDDMMTPDFISKHLQEFEKHPEADLVYCDDYLIDENSKSIRVIKRPEYKNTRMLIRDLFHCGFPVVPFRTCIRKSVFDKIGLFDENLRMAEDYDMMRRFVKYDLKIQHLPNVMYLRRMTSDSLSRNFTTQNAQYHFEVIRRFTDTFTYDELFPDVAWDQIAPGIRQLHAKCLTAGIYLALGQVYIKSNALEFSRTAFDLACSELNDCIKMDPKNQDMQQLLQKSKRIRAKYTKAAQQAVPI